MAVLLAEQQRARGQDGRDPDADEDPALVVPAEEQVDGHQERERRGQQEEGLRPADDGAASLRSSATDSLRAYGDWASCRDDISISFGCETAEVGQS
jgi:hypothetical protein